MPPKLYSSSELLSLLWNATLQVSVASANPWLLPPSLSVQIGIYLHLTLSGNVCRQRVSVNLAYISLSFLSVTGNFLGWRQPLCQSHAPLETSNYVSLWGYKGPTLPHPKETILKCRCNIRALQRKYWAPHFNLPLLIPTSFLSSYRCFFPRELPMCCCPGKHICDKYLPQIIVKNNAC